MQLYFWNVGVVSCGNMARSRVQMAGNHLAPGPGIGNSLAPGDEVSLPIFHGTTSSPTPEPFIVLNGTTKKGISALVKILINALV